MKRLKRLSILSVIMLTLFTLQAQPPKREMRAGWLATVYRIDRPTTAMTTVTSTNIAAQKAELIAILDSVKAANMNAVFFQIRPESDALYNSAYEPWSAHLGGARGTYPGYDPTAFAIEEAHKRGIELHAWLNPYRFETSAKKYAGKHTDYKALHPEWILDYAVYNMNGTKQTDGITILDPGNPAVRKLIKNVVGDILSKYDLDGIIFDDYFYAYSGTSTTLDSYSQALYKPSGMTLGDWRRENVNKMVADVYDTIQTIRPSVIFGVSPFGIWTTNSSVASSRGLILPTGITGANMYEQIYCDPVAWLEQGKVDYISPQLYWPTTSSGQDYKKLCPWWSNVVKKYDKYFYSSMSISALSSTYNAPKYYAPASRPEIAPDLHELKAYTVNGGLLSGLTRTEQRVKAAINFDDSEVGLEIDWNRNSTKNNAPGSVLYSIKHLRTNGNFTKYLREQKFTKPALTPAVNWKTHPTLGAPTNVRIEQNTLLWNFSSPDLRFAVYAIPNAMVNDPAAFNTSAYLLGVSYAKSFDLINHTSLLTTHQLAVSVVDRYSNEFTPNYIDTTHPVVGNITYELNGGVTNDHGWTNKNDMYMGLNAAWNTFKPATTTWTSLDNLIINAGSLGLVEAVRLGIPSEAAALDLTFIADATVKAEWQWLVNYMDAECTAQVKTLPSTNASFLRYNFSAFFLSSVRPTWPVSANYTEAGKPENFIPAWKHAFAGPATYDGTVAVDIPDPYKEGDDFNGWYDNAGFTGIKVTAIPVGATGNKTLYAKWLGSLATAAANDIEVQYAIKMNAQQLTVDVNQDVWLELYAINGMLLDKQMVSGQYNKELQRGVYLIRINNKTTKIII